MCVSHMMYIYYRMCGSAVVCLLSVCIIQYICVLQYVCITHDIYVLWYMCTRGSWPIICASDHLHTHIYAPAHSFTHVAVYDMYI